MKQHLLQRKASAFRRGQRGQTIIIMGFLILFVILLLGLVIDSVRLYILTAQAERTAEASALAGALYMPNYYNTLSPDGTDAVNRICAVAKQNGLTNCPATSGQVGVDPSVVMGNQYEVQVTVTLTADVFFLDYIAPNLSNATISRSALAQYLPPIQLGSRTSYFGDQADIGGNGKPLQSFWGRVNGPGSLKENGDAYTPTLEEGPTDPVKYPDGGSYSYNRWTPKPCCTNHQQWPTPIANPDQHQPGFTGAHGVSGYNYEIDVPVGTTPVQVQIYNPVFDPQQATGAVGYDDMGSAACYDPTFGTGGCKTDQKNEYLQMSYSLYSAPLPFERSADTLLTSFSPASIDNIAADNIKHVCVVLKPYWDPQAQQCVADPGYVEKWYTLYTITTPGTYRLAVETMGYYGEHEYAVKLTDSQNDAPPSGVHLWAWNEMCVYFTITGTDSIFDLGEIPAAYAGKTLDFSLFDPGDGGGNIYLRILDPSGAAVKLPSWVRTVGGSGGTEINATGAYYNALWLHLPISIPSTYNPAPGSDWWQIEYLTNGTPNDTITISISLNGSPIHLVAEVI